MKARNKFSDRKQVLARHVQDGRTQKHMARATDINNILAKYKKTGVIEHINRAMARYGDFSEYSDVATLENMDKMAKAQASFEMLPAEVRNKFNNSMVGFFSFLEAEENRPTLEKWGILKKAPPVEAKPADPHGGASGPIDPLADKRTGKAKAPPKMNEAKNSDE